MFLTREQVDQLTLAQAESALKTLTKTYKLDKSLQDYMTPELWDNLDNITNTLLYLEDRIAYVKMTTHLDSIRHGSKPDETSQEEFVTNYG